MNQLTAANLLTLLRMVLIPPFAILLLYGYRGWALLVFLAAGVTDLFDGLIDNVRVWRRARTQAEICSVELGCAP